MDRHHMLLIVLLLQALTIALKLLDEVNSIIDDDKESNNNNKHLELAEDGCEEEHQKSLSAMLFLSMFFYECRLPRGTLTGIRYGEWYIRPRSNHWWLHFEDYVMIVDAARFKELFRISQETFHYICEMVEPDLEVRTPPSFSSIPNRVLLVQKQVAIALKRLATGESFLSLSKFFGVGDAARITLKFVEALLKNCQQYLQWPTCADMLAVKRGFQAKHGFPNCCGAIDATHIIMELPEYENEIDWFDRENKFSMLVQAIVDSRTRFLDVVAGYPGSVNDARQLRVSNFAQLVQRQERLNEPSVQVSNQSIPEYIIGDAGYPLLPWLIVPFPGLNLPPKTDRYNYMHSSTRMAVGCIWSFEKIMATPQ